MDDLWTSSGPVVAICQEVVVEVVVEVIVKAIGCVCVSDVAEGGGQTNGWSDELGVTRTAKEPLARLTTTLLSPTVMH